MWFNKIKLPGFVSEIAANIFSVQPKSSSPEKSDSISHCPYMQFTFSALGYLSKIEGKVHQAHIDQVEQLMQSLNFEFEMRNRAIGWFQDGKKFHNTDVHLEDSWDKSFHLLAQKCAQMTRSEKKQNAIRQGNLQQPALTETLREMTLECMCQCVWISGFPASTTHSALYALGQVLGFDSQQIAQVESIIAERQGLEPALPQSIQLARNLLHLKSIATIESIKLAYRRQLSKNHPDKFSGGDIEQSIKTLAEENTRRLREAYELMVLHYDP